MATNLRLGPEAMAALRAEAARTGESQQELIRRAVDRYLGLGRAHGPVNERDALVASGDLLPERKPFVSVPKRVRLPKGVTTGDLLDRDDRI